MRDLHHLLATFTSRFDCLAPMVVQQKDGKDNKRVSSSGAQECRPGMFRHDAQRCRDRVRASRCTWSVHETFVAYGDMTWVHDRVHDMGYVAGAITNLLANHSAPQAKQVYAPNVQQHAPVGIKRTHSYQDSRSSQERSWTRVNEQSRVASQTRKLRNVQSMHTSHNFNP